MTTWNDGADTPVLASWARTDETPEWIAQRTDVLLNRVGELLGLGPWALVGGGEWAGDATGKAELVRARVNAGSGQAQIGDGYVLSTFARSQAVEVTAYTEAGRARVGRRLPTNTSLLDVRQTVPGALSAAQGDGLVAAMVEAWAPLSVSLSTVEVNRLARRGGWAVGPAYRLWLADEVGPIRQTADGVLASRLGEGTLLSVPGDWNAQRVVEAMEATRGLNDIDVLPH